MVNEKRLVDSFIRMVETDSVSGTEAPMRDLLARTFAEKGLEPLEDGAASLLNGNSGNLLVRIPGTIDASPILFATHMDTVEPGNGIRAVLEDGIIRSQGDTILGADDKCAIAALLEAYDIIGENHLPHPPLEFLFTVGEEQGLKGAGVFDFDLVQSRMAFVMDAGGDPGTIIIQSPCQNEIEYHVYGRAAHAGMNPEDGLNAIAIAAHALAKMPCGRIDSETTCNFGLVQGGTARNIVAEYCHIKGEARSLSREKLDQLTRQLTETFSAEVEKQGGKADTVITFLYPEIRLDPSDEVVQLAARAVRSLGLQPRFIKTGGGSDASIIHGAGIQCANLGVGMQKVHTCQEFIRVEDLVADVRLILAIIQCAAQGA